jgi:hypothetical protein
MPRGRKPKTFKQTKIKGKSAKSVSAEVQDVFFNTNIKDDEEVLETITEDIVEEIADLEDVAALTGEIPKEVEAPETVSISEGGVGDSETFMVVSSFSDEGDELQTIQSIRGNKPPEATWADKHSKFVTGQKIMPSRLTKDEIKNFECARVISPGFAFDTYLIKMSRSMNEISIKGADWVLASIDCKPYVSYWDSVSPIIKMRKS